MMLADPEPTLPLLVAGLGQQLFHCPIRNKVRQCRSASYHQGQTKKMAEQDVDWVLTVLSVQSVGSLHDWLLHALQNMSQHTVVTFPMSGSCGRMILNGLCLGIPAGPETEEGGAVAVVSAAKPSTRLDCVASFMLPNRVASENKKYEVTMSYCDPENVVRSKSSGCNCSISSAKEVRCRLGLIWAATNIRQRR